MSRSLSMAVVLTLAFAGRVPAAAVDHANRPCLVPWPQKITMRAGSFTAPARLSIEVAGKTPAGRRVADTFAYDLREIGFAPVLTTRATPTGARIVLRLADDRSLGAEGYRLSVDGGIRITAATEAGLFWGTRTALQLLAKGPGRPVPYLSISDKPLLPFRASMVDVARQFHTIGFHRQMVKRLASCKLNVYHIHFSDDQSYTLPSEKYPSLPTPGRHYSKDELKGLVRLAARYHVTILPEVDMPGHSEALSRAVPEIACRETPGQPICPSSNRSFEILKNLITEAADIFPGPYFHIGADEVNFAMWDNCPDCRARKVSENLKDNESLYNWFINRVNRFVRSKGRRTIVWTGFKPTVRPAIDKNVLVDQWDNGYANPTDLLAAGYDLLNASSTPLYVVRDWASPPEMIAEWDVWHFGPVTAPLPYVPPKIAPTERLKGVCFCSWENSESVQDAILFGIGEPVQGYAGPAPRAPIMAERAWTGSGTSKADLLRRVGWKAKH
ncbi:MAG: beta-N-acetylhexosaminidase [Armatimonadota bacterium]|nr:beta-N-acetylhexosaminidase [Armatimonadota bacterium]